MSAYVVRTSSLNDKHSCQLLRINASFSSVVLLSSSVSTANLSCLPASTFSSFRFLFNSLSSPRFNLLRVARRCYLFIFVSYPQPFFPLFFSIRSSVCFKFLNFLSERFFLVQAKAALLDFEHARVWSTSFRLRS